MNKVLLTGRIVKDLELRKTQNGMSVVKFTLAVNRKFKKEGQPDADFVTCIVWDKRADAMAQYLHKGSLIGIEGHIATGSYQGKDGKTVYTTDVVVDDFDFLEPKSTQTQPYQPQEYKPQNIENTELENQLDIASDVLPF